MKLNLNSFLDSISIALDAVEKEILGTSSKHSKKVAYIALNLAEVLNFDEKEKFDLYAYSIMHDNGVIQAYRHTNSKENFLEAENLNNHCYIGEKNIKDFPFLTGQKNIILYHHETYNGFGYFSKKAEEIPLMSQLIYLSDCIDTQFDLSHISLKEKLEIETFIKTNTNILFSKKLADSFLEVSKNDIFWYELSHNDLDEYLEKNLKKFEIEISYEKMLEISKVFSNIIDSKSEFTALHTCDLMEKAAICAQYYSFNKEDSYKLQIAANLHDLGKLATPNEILEKPGKLNDIEVFEIKKHAFLTYKILSTIKGMEEISEIASAHHEKLNGKGYPFGLKEKELSFKQRLLSALDIYQALIEDRPYRKPMCHNKAMDILFKLAKDKSLDTKIVNDINKVFSTN